MIPFRVESASDRTPAATHMQMRQSIRRHRFPAVVAALVVAAAAAVLIERQFPDTKEFRVPSESMEPTLPLNTIIDVDRSAYDEEDPERNDIVIFTPPNGANLQTCGANRRATEPCPRPTEAKGDVRFIKRIVGLPGDRLSVRDGRIVIDGVPQDEPFARASRDCPSCNLPRAVTVPPDHYFMVGDNRGQSADSREWGPVPRDWIIGKVTGTD